MVFHLDLFLFRVAADRLQHREGFRLFRVSVPGALEREIVAFVESRLYLIYVMENQIFRVETLIEHFFGHFGTFFSLDHLLFLIRLSINLLMALYISMLWVE